MPFLQEITPGLEDRVNLEEIRVTTGVLRGVMAQLTDMVRDCAELLYGRSKKLDLPTQEAIRTRMAAYQDVIDLMAREMKKFDLPVRKGD